MKKLLILAAALSLLLTPLGVGAADDENFKILTITSATYNSSTAGYPYLSVSPWLDLTTGSTKKIGGATDTYGFMETFFLHAINNGGAAKSIVVRLEHSPDKDVAYTLFDFPSITSTTNYVRSYASGPVNFQGVGRYVRAKVIFGGSGAASWAIRLKLQLKR